MRGHPILGAVSGFLFGIFLTADLFMLKVIHLDTVPLVLIPLLGLVAGILLGLFPPLRRGRAAAG